MKDQNKTLINEPENITPTLDHILVSSEKTREETSQNFDNLLLGIGSVLEILKNLKPKDSALKVLNEEGNNPDELIIKGKKGEKGDKGDPGINAVTPKKGEDYFTPSEIHEVIQEVRKLIPNPKNGNDGKPGKKGEDGTSVDFEAVVKSVIELIPNPKNGNDGKPGKKGEDGSPDKAEDIIKKISGVIKYSDIKDAPEWKPNSGKSGGPGYLREISDVAINTQPIHGQVLTYDGPSKTWIPQTPVSIDPSGVWYTEAIAGVINGSNKIFTISHTPTDPNSLQVYLGHQPQIEAIDYTLSGTTITYIIAPDASLSGDHYAKYQ